MRTMPEKTRVAFVCRENACRSQMAEALAKKIHAESGIEFVSAGMRPAKKTDRRMLYVLREEKIYWRGRPKSLSAILPVDIAITLCLDVECPLIPRVRSIAWQIPDPKGKDICEYRRVLQIIKRKISGLLEEEAFHVRKRRENLG